VAVEVRPAAGSRLVAVHHAYPARDEGGALHLELGDLYAREPSTLLVEFAASVGTAAADLRLGVPVVDRGYARLSYPSGAAIVPGFFSGAVMPPGAPGNWFSVVVGWAWLAAVSLRLASAVR
jgi:hypothetical protein